MKRAVSMILAAAMCAVSIGAPAVADETRVDTAVVVGNPRTIPTVTVPTSYGTPSRNVPDPGAPSVMPQMSVRADTYVPTVSADRPPQGYSGRASSSKIPTWVWWALGIGAGIGIYQASK